MKVDIDEKVKHRFVGIAVIISIGIVFAPAVLKKSQHHLEDGVSLSVKLPPKPLVPQVSVREPKTLFQTVKVAHVDVPSVDKSLLSAATLAKAESLSSPGSTNTLNQIDSKIETIPHVLKESNSSELVQTAELDSSKLITPQKKAMDTTSSQVSSIKLTPVLSKQSSNVTQRITEMKQVAVFPGAYGVQVATFTRHANAIAMVGNLKKKGYKAHYNTVREKNGVVYYKVVVGHSKERVQAQRLKKQLSQSVQINGFIVKKGIS